MVPCSPKAAQIATLGLSTVVLALLRWAFPSLTQIDPMTLDPPPAEVQSCTTCTVCTLPAFPDWTWSCDLELNVFMETLPEDIFALTAIFQKTSHMMRELKCEPHQYPIKMIVAGGQGRDAEGDWSKLKRYVSELQRSKLVPDASQFPLRILKGPTSDGYIAERHAVRGSHWKTEWLFDHVDSPLDYHEWLDSDKGPVSTLVASLPGTMDILINQKSPTIIALRPLYEFAPIWTELRLAEDPSALKLVPNYAARRRTSIGEPMEGWNTLETSIDKLREAFQAIGRSKFITYQGKSTFASLSMFFQIEIMDEDTTDNPFSHVSDLEETFVNLPEAFILMDRESITSNRGLVETPLFDATTQPAVFKALASWVGKEVLYELIRNVNLPVALDKNRSAELHLAALPPPNNEKALQCLRDIVFLSSFRGYRESLGQTVGLQDAAARLHAKIREVTKLMIRTGPTTSAEDINRATLPVRAASWWADASFSWVVPSSLLIPFWLSSEPNLVKDSLQRVKYGGWTRGDELAVEWVWAPVSQSTIWFTNASSTLDPRVAQARQQRLRRELEEMYTTALDPGKWE